MTTKEQAAKYRVLTLEVDKARGAYAIADMKYLKEPTKSSTISSTKAMSDLIQAQDTLDRHVNEYGVPKLGQRY